MSELSFKVKIKALYKTHRVIRPLLYIPVFIYGAVWIYYNNLKEQFYSYKYYHSAKLYKINHLTIGIKKLGENKTKFPHPIGIVIGIGVKIGKNCIIYQNVTIGAKTPKDADNGIYPNIGDNVIIGCNAVIIGNIKVGNNVKIGASTLVNCDIPDNCTVVGNPCRIIMN